MADQGRQAWMFVAGALLGGAVAVWAYLSWFTPTPAPAAPVAAAAPTVPPPRTDPVEEILPATTRTAAAEPPTSCAFQPLVTRSSERDGLFTLDRAAIQRSANPAPFLAVADEAAREGRARDAEVALIAACRIAGEVTAGSPVQSRLSRHYASVAAREPDRGTRVQMLERAEALLGSPVQVQVAAPAATQETSRLGASRLSLADRPPVRSEPVVRLDEDLERLYSQARAVSRDPSGLERRHQQALAQRAACRGDEECLRSWHAQRKRQLFSEFAAR